MGLPLDPEDETGSTLFDLQSFAEYSGDSGYVRFTTNRPDWINLPYTGGVGEWERWPQLQNSTHRCWNWGRPDICWDALNSLGFKENLIGKRPAYPNKPEEEKEV